MKGALSMVSTTKFQNALKALSSIEA